MNCQKNQRKGDVAFSKGVCPLWGKLSEKGEVMETNHVLIVEDDKEIREGVQIYLQSQETTRRSEREFRSTCRVRDIRCFRPLTAWRDWRLLKERRSTWRLWIL